MWIVNHAIPRYFITDLNFGMMASSYSAVRGHRRPELLSLLGLAAEYDSRPAGGTAWAYLSTSIPRFLCSFVFTAPVTPGIGTSDVVKVVFVDESGGGFWAECGVEGVVIWDGG